MKPFGLLLYFFRKGIITNFVEQSFDRTKEKEDMNNTRDYIIEKAFEQYLTNGYEGVSISVLQESMNIGRATLYYHFSNKEALFDEVINFYVTRVFKNFMGKIDRSSITIPDLIGIFTEMNSHIKQTILKANIPNVKYSNYTGLIIHAYMHDQQFSEFMHNMLHDIYSAWKAAIQNSIQKGDIREDVDINILASLFTGIKEGMDLGIKEESILSQKSDEYCTNAHYLYNLIRR